MNFEIYKKIFKILFDILQTKIKKSFIFIYYLLFIIFIYLELLNKFSYVAHR